jgi:small conductance mechanosensitive channel
MILLFKPYKVGDFIDINGKKGTVTNINIFHTEMKSPDHRTIITPNAVITSDTVINHTTIGTLRVDVSVGISYSADIQQAKSVLTQVIADNEYIINEPAPGVFVNEL